MCHALGWPCATRNTSVPSARHEKVAKRASGGGRGKPPPAAPARSLGGVAKSGGSVAVSLALTCSAFRLALIRAASEAGVVKSAFAMPKCCSSKNGTPSYCKTRKPFLRNAKGASWRTNGQLYIYSKFYTQQRGCLESPVLLFVDYEYVFK